MTRFDGIENQWSYLAEHRHDWYAAENVIACDVACCFTSRHADDVSCAEKDPAPLATAGVRQPTNRSGGYMSKSSASAGFSAQQDAADDLTRKFAAAGSPSALYEQQRRRSDVLDAYWRGDLTRDQASEKLSRIDGAA